MLNNDNPRTYLALLRLPVELRIINAKTKNLGTVSGYYDDLEKLARACDEFSDFGAEAVYTTLNPVKPDVMARAYNRYEKFVKHTTTDADIARRVWLPIDCDSEGIRPKGTSSTDAEHEAALGRVQAIRADLTAFGFPAGLFASSGNGGHVLYQLDMPNTPEITHIIQAFLATLANRFDDKSVKVDKGVFNAARIWKVYGTMCRKGDEILGRNHRKAKIIELPPQLETVPLDLIQAYTAKYGKPAIDRPSSMADAGAFERSVAWVQGFLDRHDIETNRERQDAQGRQVWRLQTCPLCGESDKSAVITVAQDGRMGFKCQHNRCSDKHWSDFRQHHEPGCVSDHHKLDDEVDKVVSGSGGASLPTIWCGGRPLSAMVDDAKQALLRANNPPRLFERGGVLTRLRFDADASMPFFEPLGDGGMIDELSRAARWVKATKTAWVDCLLPDQLIRVFKGQPDCGLPVVRSIIETPTFSAEGGLLDKSGYQPAARVWLQSSIGPMTIPDKPTSQQVQAGKTLFLSDLLGDFPFADDASRAHALALMLLPFVRLMIDGPTPLHAIDAPQEGSGKGLLASVFGMVASGRSETSMTEAHDEAEWSKLITAKLMTGPAYILLDNLRKALDSASLASALTARVWEGRILGVSKLARLPVDCVWLVTGNNIKASREITRRIVRIRLDALTESPHLRTGFRHTDLLGWCKKNRARLVEAALTLVKAWIVEGKPLGKYTMGSFQAWASTIGGILDVADVKGFFGNQAELFEDVNTSQGEWRQFVEGWGAIFGEQPVEAAKLYEMAEEHSLLTSWFAKNKRPGEGHPVVRFGLALAHQKGRTYGKWHVEQQWDKHANANRWRVHALPESLPDVVGPVPAADEKERIEAERLTKNCRAVSKNGRAVEPLLDGRWRGGFVTAAQGEPIWTREFDNVASASAWMRVSSVLRGPN